LAHYTPSSLPRLYGLTRKLAYGYSVEQKTVKPSTF
jgi:hypothetical protein